jgi:triosephosphate isomerase
MQITNQYTSNLFNLKSSQKTDMKLNRTGQTTDSVSFKALPGKQISVGFNHKMYQVLPSGVGNYVKTLVTDLGSKLEGVKVTLFPNSVNLDRFLSKAEKTGINIGAQDFHIGDQASTARTSFKILDDLGIKKSLVGHSEVRADLGDTDEIVNKKLHQLLANEKKAVLCVGDSLEEKLAGKTNEIVEQQVLKALDGITAEQMKDLEIAYEPISAIAKNGVPGIECKPEDANATIGHIRKVVAREYGDEIANNISILYGGSVKPNNAEKYVSQREIGGVLVGSGGTKPEDAAGIVKACQDAFKKINA